MSSEEVIAKAKWAEEKISSLVSAADMAQEPLKQSTRVYIQKVIAETICDAQLMAKCDV